MQARSPVLVWLCAVAGALGASACGDDAGGAQACPVGVVVGQQVQCACDAAGTMLGIATCAADLKLTACDCTSGVAGTVAPVTGGTAPVAGTGTTGGTGMTGGTGVTGGTGMTGGTGVMGGAGGSGGGDAMVPDPDAGTVMRPMDGDQLSVCESAIDCNRGLDCNGVGRSDGYCTGVCQNDGECDGIAGASYTCSFNGLCEVACEGADDTMSCPDGMNCILVGGGGGGAFRCAYVGGGGDPATGEPWSICMGDSDCKDDNPCLGDAADGVGACGQTCMSQNDCTVLPASGDIDPECFPVGPMQAACRLPCGGGSNCPDNMVCIGGGGGGNFQGFCDYPAM